MALRVELIVKHKMQGIRSAGRLNCSLTFTSNSSGISGAAKERFNQLHAICALDLKVKFLQVLPAPI